MFSLFKCKHPAKSLTVRSRQIIEPHDDDFVKITFPMRCQKCGEDFNLSAMSFRVSVDHFLNNAKELKT
jgi:hypothetical protein